MNFQNTWSFSQTSNHNNDSNNYFPQNENNFQSFINDENDENNSFQSNQKECSFHPSAINKNSPMEQKYSKLLKANYELNQKIRTQNKLVK